MSIDEETLKRILVETINEHQPEYVINDEEYKTQREFVGLQIEKYRRRQEMYQKFRLSFIGALGVSLVGAMIWIGGLILQALKLGSHQ